MGDWFKTIARVRIVACALVTALVQGVSFAAEPSADHIQPSHIVIGLDISASTPLVSSAPYAANVARTLATMISALPPRSKVTLRTLGDYNPRDELIRQDWTISTLNRAEDVAGIVQSVVGAIPSLVAKGRIRQQMTTNILGFLQNMAQIVDCKAYRTDVVLLSDGMEDSPYVRLINTQATLPLPPSSIFKDCEQLEILGIGSGSRDPRLTPYLRDQWGAWAKAAGFNSFTGLND